MNPQNDFPIERSVALPPPLSSFAQSSRRMSKDHYNMDTKSKPAASISSTMRDGPRRHSGNWHVELVEEAPWYFTLEKTRTTVDQSMGNCQDIADRLSDAFRLMSIDATYDYRKTTTARLVSSDQVRMDVNLFVDSQSKGTIVEVQRKTGCALSFHHYARCILRAAAHDIRDENSFLESCLRPTCPPATLQKPVVSQAMELEKISSAIEKATQLLRSDRLCANILGMESLAVLTQPEKTSRLTAVLASRSILCSCPHDGSDAADDRTSNWEIRDMVFSCIAPGTCQYDHPYDAKYKDILHRLALEVLANALRVVASEGYLKEILEAQYQCVDVVPALFNDLDQSAIKHPNNAYLSAKCIHSLVTASGIGQDIVHGVLGEGAIDSIHRAKEVGFQYCANLERECDQLCDDLSAHQ